MASSDNKYEFTVRSLPKTRATLTANITMTVKLHWLLRLRIWLAMRLLWLSAWLLYWQLDIETDAETLDNQPT